MLRRFLRYLERVYHFSSSLDHLQDTRHHPSISTRTVYGCVLLLFVLRLRSLNAFEAHYRWKESKKAWRVFLGQSPPSADTLGYTLARFDCESLRREIHRIYTILQRNHLIRQFRVQGWLVLSLDGHELFSSYWRCCDQCCVRRIQTAQGERSQYYHRVVMAQLLGGPFALPLDLEPIQPGEDEVSAGIRLMKRLFKNYPKAFDVVSTDGLYGRRGFAQLMINHRKHLLFVLKENHSDLLIDAKGVFAQQKPSMKQEGRNLYQRWDEEGFDPWPEIKRPLRIVRSYETKSKGKPSSVSDWYWCTTLPKAIVSTETVCQIGHKRWEIENQGFNILVNYYHLDHCFKHHPNAILAFALICFIAYLLFQMFYYRNLKYPFPRRGSLQFIALIFLESLKEILKDRSCLFSAILNPG